MDQQSYYQPGQTVQPGGSATDPPEPANTSPGTSNPQPDAANTPPPVPADEQGPGDITEKMSPPPPGSNDDAVSPSTTAQNLPPLLSWEASEYIDHSHGFLWYLGVLVTTAGLVVLSVLLFKEWLGAVVIVLMMLALVVYARRAPRVLKYQLNAAGIGIGQKFFPFSEFRSFAILPERSFFMIELEPLRRFMPRLSIFLEKSDAQAVSGALEQHLPREDRKPDAIDRLSRKLKL